MADPIRADLMADLLVSDNWQFTAAMAEYVLPPTAVFPRPLPEPRPALLVPVDVQALYVPKSHRERYVRLPLDMDDGQDDVAPFSTPVARTHGVHLHWAMPDGLLRGEMVDDNDTPIKMRPLPDRWLVVRMTGRRGATSQDHKAWIIEADKGSAFELEKYPGDPVAKSDAQVEAGELTGVIGGSPNWTASYDATLNRFAFHDPLDDLTVSEVTTGRASYVVIGWWSSRTGDPLAGVYSPWGVPRRIKSLGWTASSAPKVSDWQPPQVHRSESDGRFGTVDLKSTLKLTTSGVALLDDYREYGLDHVTIVPKRELYETVMHGAVYGVPVRGRVGRDAAPRASAIKLSMAPTLERLLAAQASAGMRVSGTARKEFMETLMTAVANTSLMRVDERDGVIGLDEAEHADGFEAFQGPDVVEEIVADRQREDFKAGRPLRTKAARSKTPRPPKADLIWNGRKRGGLVASKDELRDAAASYSDDTKKTIRATSDAPVFRTVRRPGPRYHMARPPVVGLRNYGKSNRFLGDGLFSEDGYLHCRWTREIRRKFAIWFPLERYVPELTHEAIPNATAEILRDAFLNDAHAAPWVLDAFKETIEPERIEATQTRYVGELALRHSPDGVFDGMSPLLRSGEDVVASGKVSRSVSVAVQQDMLRFSLLGGREVSPVAVTNYVQPWCPIWLEWEIALEPGEGFKGWSLDRVTFEGASIPRGGTFVLSGRSAITTGLSKTFKSVIDTYLIAEAQRDITQDGEIGGPTARTLASLSGFLDRTDLGSITIDRLSDVWLAIRSGPDGKEMSVPEEVADEFKAVALPSLVADGTLRLTRARVIDTFGRYRDINTNNPTLPVALATKDSSGNAALAMPPRLTLPSRLMWRFVDPADSAAVPREARIDQRDPARTINPVAGYILPDFMDESLEFFDQDGNPLGEILHDAVTGGLAWEGGVGREGPVSSSPRSDLPISASRIGDIADGMIAADVFQRNDPEFDGEESPLSAFLRAVDTTMWSVDGSLTHAGATIAGLVGRPIAVVKTQLWLDIPKDLASTGAFGQQADNIAAHLVRQGVYEAVKSRAFGVRLGELAKGNDGLYGYFIGDDFSTLNVIEKEVRSSARISKLGTGFRTMLGGVADTLGPGFLPVPDPLKSPYISAGEALAVHAGQRVNLTLLMHPTARVHATTGFLPRKALELMREWVTKGMGRIAPSARVGPVLIDPDRVRLPKIAAFGASQTWTRRNTPLTWRYDPILAATQAAVLPAGRVTVEEGYIRITPDEDIDNEPGAG
ncbi:hypothetical protein MUY35_01240 [Aliiroseovarius sp. S1339]|uniref:hypothetical protein n=1 Tax=Aliiroseovarius sp. S1339 TaxID=2936990 RepID=UPI0020BEC3F0|nr:hypothetical protein [Aliiroseovarius sp. S1339]MCK8462471.1 hypothetical protein [Aliiroseovarius sp. S1339]